MDTVEISAVGWFHYFWWYFFGYLWAILHYVAALGSIFLVIYLTNIPWVCREINIPKMSFRHNPGPPGLQGDGARFLISKKSESLSSWLIRHKPLVFSKPLLLTTGLLDPTREQTPILNLWALKFVVTCIANGGLVDFRVPISSIPRG